MQELAEWVRGNGFLGDAHLLAIDPYALDPEIRAVMRHPGIGQQLHGRCRASHEREIANQRPWLNQYSAEKLGHEANGGEYVAVRLIRVVKHIPSLLPAPEFANFQTVETVPIRIHRRAKSSDLKPYAISRKYLY